LADACPFIEKIGRQPVARRTPRRKTSPFLSFDSRSAQSRPGILHFFSPIHLHRHASSSKRPSARVLAVLTALAAVTELQRRVRQDHPYLVQGARGRPIATTTYQSTLTKIGSDLPLSERLTTHRLRHYAECLVMPSEALDLARSPVISSADVLADSA
jgi:integrase